MTQDCIHIFGAAGSGTSTLGKEIAKELSISFFDVDDYYWQKTNPPYTIKNPPQKRIDMILKDMSNTQSWVLSGSLVSWGHIFSPLFSIAIFLSLPQDLRLTRLRLREKERFGKRIEQGGDMFKASQDFLEWAALYETAGLNIRSRSMHENWLKRLNCPVLRVESSKPAKVLAKEIVQNLNS